MNIRNREYCDSPERHAGGKARCQSPPASPPIPETQWEKAAPAQWCAKQLPHAQAPSGRPSKAAPSAPHFPWSKEALAGR